MYVARAIAVALTVAAPSFAGAAELRVASWNIANLASAPGVPLRGQARTEQDYTRIAEYIRLLRPDIIALQEIGSVPGAQRVLGDGWRIVFETRCMTNARKCEADNDDIYTAIAYRDEIADRVSTFQVDTLAMDHTDECGITRPIRGGVGVKLDFGGQQSWVLSVHMKAACKDNDIEPGTEDDCATQRKQYDALKVWIEGRPPGDAIIIAGDFNRRLLKAKDSIRREIFESLSRRPQVQFLPDEESRTCWRTHKLDLKALVAEARKNNPAFDKQGLTPRIYSPAFNSGIDFFVVVNAGPQMRLASEQIETDGSYRFERPGQAVTTCDGSILPLSDGKEAWAFGHAYPSDHCPILLSVVAQ